MDATIQDQSIVLAHERPFRLGAVEVRPSTREVVGPRGRVVVEPKVMQVLVALAQAGGEILGRDDLIARCWDGRVVGEDAISRVISRLRRLSEGLGRDGWRLETVTKVGYRLLPAGYDPDAPTVATLAPSPPQPNRRLLLAGAAGLAVTAAGVGGVVAGRARRPAPPKDAVVLYEKAVEALRQGLPEPTAQAVGFLREAVADAPDYADAWGGLSEAYRASIIYTEPEHQAGVSAQARAAARRALDLDPRNRRGATTLALLAPTYGAWGESEALMAKALRSQPGEPSLEIAYARLLTGVGRLREAITHAQRAVAADAFAPFYRYALAQALWGAGRNEEAEQTLLKALERWPRHYALYFLRFNMLCHTGRPDQALAFSDDPERRPVTVPLSDIELSRTGARALASRAPGDIRAAIDAHMAASRRGSGYAENAIDFMVAFGRTDLAYQLLRALYLNEGFVIGRQRFSPDQGRYQVAGARNTYRLFMPPVAPLRGDPQFADLLRSLGLARYWQTSRHPADDPALAPLARA